MEIINENFIRIRRSEISKTCPSRPAWSASMIDNLGLEAVLESKKLEKYARCLTVLDAAKVRYEIIEDVPERPELVDEMPEPVASGPGPAPEPG